MSAAPDARDLSLPGPRLLRGHRRRRRRLLRQLPQVHGARAHRVAGRAGLRRWRRSSASTASCSSSTASRSTSGSRRGLNDRLDVTVDAASSAARARLVAAQEVRRGDELLAEARVTLACVDAATLAPGAHSRAAAARTGDLRFERAPRPLLRHADRCTRRSSCRRCWLLLVVLSLWSWWQIFLKMFQLKRAMRETDDVRGRVLEGRRPGRRSTSARAQSRTGSGLEHIFTAGFREFSKHRKQGSAVGGHARRRAPRDARHLPARDRRARSASRRASPPSARCRPYIGLFGTVWGIMNAFRGLANVQPGDARATSRPASPRR